MPEIVLKKKPTLEKNVSESLLKHTETSRKKKWHIKVLEAREA